jgi:urease accessory protein
MVNKKGLRMNQLALMQLSDSFFPSGSFTLSHGLEVLVQDGQVKNCEDLQIFLRILLRNKLGTMDVVALLHAYRGSRDGDLETVQRADNYLFSQTLTAKNRETGRKSGRALLMVACQTWPDAQLEILNRDVEAGKMHGLHPIIFGVVGRVILLSEEDTVLAFLHSLVTGLLGSAIRLGVIGHIQAQQVLGQLAPDIEAIYPRSVSLGLEQMHGSSPVIDLAQMQHRRLTQRLFAS